MVARACDTEHYNMDTYINQELNSFAELLYQMDTKNYHRLKKINIELLCIRLYYYPILTVLIYHKRLWSNTLGICI